MFDLTSSKLLILGVIALIVIGPKDLPILLRTIGKYVGMMRRQANEFRAQFDEAIRDTELEQIKKDVETLGRDTENSIRQAEHSFNQDISSVNADVDKVITEAGEAGKIEPPVHHDHLNGLFTPETGAPAEVTPLHPAEQPVHAHVADAKPVAESVTAKSGA
jgi:sec-independent protein translocase protein TatB